jgi:hypothetical protein
MEYNIDLQEPALRESGKVGWKENGDDRDSVKIILIFNF